MVFLKGCEAVPYPDSLRQSLRRCYGLGNQGRSPHRVDSDYSLVLVYRAGFLDEVSYPWNDCLGPDVHDHHLLEECVRRIHHSIHLMGVDSCVVEFREWKSIPGARDFRILYPWCEIVGALVRSYLVRSYIVRWMRHDRTQGIAVDASYC